MLKKIAIIGGGTMGRSIGLAFAMYGYDVRIVEIAGQVRDQLSEYLSKTLDLLFQETLITEVVRNKTPSYISLFEKLNPAVQDCDYIIEAVPEDLELKQHLFRELDEIAPEKCIFSSNTSSLVLSDIFKTVSSVRKTRCMICHWYNPGHLIPIVELSYFGEISDAAFEEVEALYQAIGKQTVKVAKEVPGLVANRIQMGIAREVFSLIENKVASPEDIDKALKFGPAFRYATTGQLQIADFGGLDIWCTVGDNLLADMDHSTESNTLLRQKVAEGKLGLKSGEGFFKYSGEVKNRVIEQYTKKLIRQLIASRDYVE